MSEGGIEMPYIPKNAKWFLADIVLEIKIQGEIDNIVHVNLTLIEAKTSDEAYDRACEVGKSSEITCENTDGKRVNIKFRGLRDLNVIHDQLAHGSELTYEELIGLNEEQLSGLVNAKQLLSVFRS